MQVSFTNLCFIINIYIIPYMHFRHYSLRNKISFTISFQCSLKFIWSKSSMELPPEFHGTFWTTFEQHLWLHGIPWNSMEFCPDPKFHGIPWNFFHTPEFLGIPWNSMELHPPPQKKKKVPWNSMEFHGILSRSKVPWNSMEHFPYSRVPWNSMEFHGTSPPPPKKKKFHGIPWNSMELFLKFHGIPWNLINFIFKKIIFLNIVFGIWLMIRCYLAKISQKRYVLHWFQYRNSYFEHPSVSENGTMSAKMACCYT